LPSSRPRFRRRPWIEDADAPVTTPEPVFPEAAALAKLRGNRDWLERWAAPPPSLSWSDVVSSLVVKYQQNPLRAQRNHTYAQVAIHDGSFGEAHPQRPYGNLY
jgi:hypothetical protein